MLKFCQKCQILHLKISNLRLRGWKDRYRIVINFGEHKQNVFSNLYFYLWLLLNFLGHHFGQGRCVLVGRLDDGDRHRRSWLEMRRGKRQRYRAWKRIKVAQDHLNSLAWANVDAWLRRKSSRKTVWWSWRKNPLSWNRPNRKAPVTFRPARTTTKCPLELTLQRWQRWRHGPPVESAASPLWRHAAKVWNRNHQLFFRWSNSAKLYRMWLTRVCRLHSSHPARLTRNISRNPPTILTGYSDSKEKPRRKAQYLEQIERESTLSQPRLTQEREDAAEAAFGTGVGGQEIFCQKPS